MERTQIARVSLITSAPRAPYSLEPMVFPLPALASLVGRSPLGGPREIALACLVVARLLADRADRRSGLTPEQRRARVKGARQWLGTAAVPAGTRAALVRLSEATVDGDRTAIRTAVDGVIAVTANQLDQAARSELARLAQAVAE